MIQYQTSPMKCESIYKYSIYIAEFWNSLTSLSFLLVVYIVTWIKK